MKQFTDILEYIFFEYKDFKLTVLSIVSIFLIYFLTRFMIWTVSKLLDKILAKKSIPDHGRRLAVMQITKYFLYTLAVLFSMQSIGLDLSILLAGSAALLVGIGFGLQHTFNDFISGLILLFDRSIEVGDIIQIDSLVGKVKQIGLRATTIYTREAISVIVPNSKFTQENVINWSHDNKLTRFNIKVGVAYGSDVPLVMQTLVAAAKTQAKVYSTPEVSARFIDFGDSALLFEVLFWTQDPFDVEFIKSDIRVAIDAAFRAAKIQVPFPQRDLHIISDHRNTFK